MANNNKVKKNDKNNSILEYSLDDPEIKAIFEKYPKRGLNPFANKKNKQLIEEEIKALLKAREEAKRLEELRIREEKRIEKQKQLEEQRKIQRELQKEKLMSFLNKNKIVISIVLVLLVTLGITKAVIDKRNATVREISFTFGDEGKYVGDLLDLTYIVDPLTAVYNEDEIEIFVNDESLISADGEDFKCDREGTLIAKIIYKNKEMDSKTISIKPVLINKLYVEDFEIGRGNSLTLDPIIEPENATNKSYTVSVDDTEIVTVKDGVVTGVGIGSTIIHLKSSDGFSYDTKVDVIEIEPTSIRINGLQDNYIVGDEDNLSIAFEPIEATLRDYTLSSSNNSVVSIDQEGHLVAKGKGKATITAYHNGEVIDRVDIITDYPDPSSISITNTSDSMYANNGLQLYTKIEPDPVSDKTVSWTSSDENIATVNSNGYVSAKSEGKVKITAKTFNGKTASILITVNAAVTRSNSGNASSDNYSRNTSGTSYVLNTNTKKFHKPSCRDVSKIKASNRQDVSWSRDEVIQYGYSPCGHCHP